jgi:D-arabinose 1-dehydrogenase-like Zn-dependent alcohol dehydrogenase
LTDIIGPSDVLIKLNATGICHSDLHFMLNDWALPKMSVFGVKCAGHEGAGVIVKVGDQVKTLKPGMRAGYKVSCHIVRQRSLHHSCNSRRSAYGDGRMLISDSPSKIPVVPASFAGAETSATAQKQS